MPPNTYYNTYSDPNIARGIQNIGDIFNAYQQGKTNRMYNAAKLGMESERLNLARALNEAQIGNYGATTRLKTLEGDYQVGKNRAQYDLYNLPTDASEEEALRSARILFGPTSVNESYTVDGRNNIINRTTRPHNIPEGNVAIIPPQIPLAVNLSEVPDEIADTSLGGVIQKTPGVIKNVKPASASDVFPEFGDISKSEDDSIAVDNQLSALLGREYDNSSKKFTGPDIPFSERTKINRLTQDILYSGQARSLDDAIHKAGKQLYGTESIADAFETKGEGWFFDGDPRLEVIQQPMSPQSPIIPQAGQRITVQDKNGKKFTLPAEQLEEAMAQGYVPVQ